MKLANLLVIAGIVLSAAGLRADGLGSYGGGRGPGRVVNGAGASAIDALDEPGMRLSRPRGGFQGPGYRRPPTGTARVPGAQRQGLVRRAMGEYGGYDLRDGLVLGTGRMAAGRYDTERDQRTAEHRGRWVSGAVRRVGGAVRRLVSP